MSDPPPRSPSSLSRRRAIATASATATALLAGCQALPFGETVPTGHLFVENQEDEPFEIAVSVIRRSDGEPIVQALYRVPGSHVLQFEDVLDTGNSYTLRTNQPAIERQGPTSLSVTVETCQPDDPAGKTDVGILASSNGAEIVVYDCENAYTRTGDLTYVDPSQYEVRELDEPIASPTPS